jgi:hypothetical protein
MSLKIIPVNNKLFIIIDFVFKFSIGLFIIIFFSTRKVEGLSDHDNNIIILSGFVLLLLINYIIVINILFNKNLKNDLYDIYFLGKTNNS